MVITSTTTEKNPTEEFITVSGVDNGVNVAFANGLASSEVLVGYSEISWGIKDGYTPPAGDYSATVTITITSESQTGGETV